MEKIDIKLKGIPKQTNRKMENDWLAIGFEIEPYNYKGQKYSEIILEFKTPDNKIDWEILKDGNKITIELQKNIKIEDNKLVFSQPFDYKKTNFQEITDKTKKVAQKVGDTSSNLVKKTGQGIKSAGDKLENATDNSQWPRWVLPVIIGFGIVLLLVLLIKVFSGSKKNRYR